MSETVNEEMGNTPLLTNSSTHLPLSTRTHPLTNSSTHPPNNTPIIQVKHLSKRYQIGMDRTYKTFCESAVDTIKSPLKRLKSFSRQEETFWALKDINFEVYPGEVVGIIGRNGAGKSTLLKILSRITHPTEGEIILRGRVASLLEVGTGFHPELTGRENVYFNGAILGMTKQEIEAKFDEIVAFSGVADFLDTPLKRYSSGMQVRLAFAVAAHLEPEILLVDEVLAVGDAEFQKKCLGKMDEVAKGGRTVLFVSHNMTAVRRICPRVILLDYGGIVTDGPANQVITRYLESGINVKGERIWTDIHRAPGNEVVRLSAVRALNQNGNVADQFDVTEPFNVELEFDVLEPGYLLNAGFYFTNVNGERIFSVEDLQSEQWQNKTRPIGIHRSICHIPANLLNEGEISIQAHVCTEPHTCHAREIDALAIRIMDDFKHGGARGNYTGDWPVTVVRPLLDWSFKFEK